MSPRTRSATLAALVLIVAGVLLYGRVRGGTDYPVSGPVPPSSVPTPDGRVNGVHVQLTPVAPLTEPTALATRNGDPGLYVARQNGHVARVEGSRQEDVLDISSTVIDDGEQGLLGIAFSPDGQTLFATSTNRDANQQLDAFAMKGNAPDPASRRTLLVIPDFAPNHNGGDVLFGPDGFLYWTMGDGGGGGDPKKTGQDPHDLLGDVLRIDPLHPGADGKPYAIPADNPFADGRSGAPEVYEFGLRNPWRISFDRATHDVWIADVGQSAIEEVDFVAAGSKGGLNFGWSEVEGTHPYRSPTPPPEAVPPIYEYDHSNGRCSITGGFVYRGTAIPDLAGTYVFADYCDGIVHGLTREANGSVAVNDLGIAAEAITSFGEDGDGNLYVLSQTKGVFRIDPADAPSTTAPTSTTAPPPTTSALPAAPSPDPATAAQQLAAAEHALRDPQSSPVTLAGAARLQQLAYRQLGQHPETDDVVLANVPDELREVVRLNLDARHELAAIPGAKLRDTLPAWRIDAPAAEDDLLAAYHEAESTYGVGWNYLAAINLVESAMGRIHGFSSAGAQGPMQFMPATWDTYGGGGDIDAPRDSILAAARFLQHNGFTAGNVDGALFSYNNSEHYVKAIEDIAAVLAADPAAYHGYYRWEVFYVTTLGSVHLPVGYDTQDPIPAADYLAAHPDALVP